MRNGVNWESGVVDAAVIGGSFAGISAALQLARGRRQVVVIDAGQTRNRLASAGHGFLGLDGRPRPRCARRGCGICWPIPRRG